MMISDQGEQMVKRRIVKPGTVKRRNVLKLGAASVAGALINIPSRALGAALTSPHFASYRAVFDGRFEDGLAFADEFRRRGIPTVSVGPDIARLWYGELQVNLSQPRTPIAGLTDRATLFCLEELARGVGMRVIFRVDHVIDEDGDKGGDADTGAFGRQMAQLVDRVNHHEHRDASAPKRTGPFSPEDKTALVSWIIA
jgi:hypothetical protein